MRIFSTFSGIGGFEIGIQNAYRSTFGGIKANKARDDEDYFKRFFTTSWEDSSTENGRDGERTTDIAHEGPLFVGYSEIDKYAESVYNKQFGGTKNYGDITKINADELPDFDCLVGGFPCQAFSIAGKRGGFDDTRGTLFFDLARILRAKQPRLFVFENVKGLLSHDGGTTFRTIINTIAELGYDAQWQVVNSKNFGVPQNRERVIIVGHLRGTPRPKVFPITGVSGRNLREITNKVSDAQRIYTTDLAKSQKALGGGMGAKTGLYAVHKSHGEIKETDSISHAIDSSYHKGLDNHGQRTGVAKQLVDGLQVRRLTPLECERLQGFPDNWTQYGIDYTKGFHIWRDNVHELTPISDSQRYKMCGNAVTTNVIQAVFERIFA